MLSKVAKPNMYSNAVFLSKLFSIIDMNKLPEIELSPKHDTKSEYT
jgi:hypothetical protein